MPRSTTSVAFVCVLVVALAFEYVAAEPQKKFKVGDNVDSFEDATARCASFNMTLATIESEEETAQALAAIEADQRHSYYFTAGHKLDGKWVWGNSDKPIGSYTKWSYGFPDDEECLVLDDGRGTVTWKSKTCGNKRPVLCQELPAPAPTPIQVVPGSPNLPTGVVVTDENSVAGLKLAAGLAGHPFIQIFSGAQVTININGAAKAGRTSNE